MSKSIWTICDKLLFSVCGVLIVNFFALYAQQAPQFRGDLQNTGVFSGPAPKHGKIKWKFRTGGIVVSSPVADNGVVYFGSNDSHFYAVNIQNGELRWKFKTNRKIYAGSAIHGDGVYFGGTDKTFYALDISTGKLKWKVTADDMFFASPIIFENKIYIGSGSSFVKPAKSDLYVLDLNEKGKLLTRFRANGAIKKSAAIWSDNLYFKSRDHHVYAVNRKTKKGIWYYELKNHFSYGSVVVGHGQLYTTDDNGGLYALDLVKGKLKWKFEARDRIDTTPAVTEDTVYFGSSDTILYALEASTGKRKWRYKSALPIRSSPVISEETIYFAGDDKKVHALDMNTGKQKWQVQLGGITRCDSPYIAEGILFVGNNDHHLYAIE